MLTSHWLGVSSMLKKCQACASASSPRFCHFPVVLFKAELADIVNDSKNFSMSFWPVFQALSYTVFDKKVVCDLDRWSGKPHKTVSWNRAPFAKDVGIGIAEVL